MCKTRGHPSKCCCHLAKRPEWIFHCHDRVMKISGDCMGQYGTVTAADDERFIYVKFDNCVNPEPCRPYELQLLYPGVETSPARRLETLIESLPRAGQIKTLELDWRCIDGYDGLVPVLVKVEYMPPPPRRGHIGL